MDEIHRRGHRPLGAPEGFEVPAVETMTRRSVPLGARLAATPNSSEADRIAYLEAVRADGRERAEYMIRMNTAALRGDRKRDK